MSETNRINIMSLLITGVAIILVLIVWNNLKRNSNKEDSFVGRVPLTPIGNGPYYGDYSNIPPGVQPTGQPMMYAHELYTKFPYYGDSINQQGRPCQEKSGCGSLGACVNGVCTIKDQYDTVFDIKI